jgi:hypothetical protein
VERDERREMSGEWIAERDERKKTGRTWYHIFG